MLLAAIVDNTRLLAWLQSEDGVNGVNRPKSLLSKIMEVETDSDEIVSFDSGEEFDETWRKLTGKEA